MTNELTSTIYRKNSRYHGDPQRHLSSRLGAPINLTSPIEPVASSRDRIFIFYVSSGAREERHNKKEEEEVLGDYERSSESRARLN